MQEFKWQLMKSLSMFMCSKGEMRVKNNVIVAINKRYL